MFRLISLLSIAAVFVVSAGNSGAAADPTARELDFFEKKIRPVLVKHCYECHSAESEELGGKLLLDTRAGSRKGGESGHAVVPGDIKESLLINALRFEDFEMPPEEALPENVIADFEKWIKMGAPDPRDGLAKTARKGINFDKAREFWSFRPITAPQPPKVSGAEWARSDIDRFVLARMEAKDLKPVADAQPQALVRRLYFDLIGLPPTPAQVDEFVADPSPEAFRALVDRLLDSPQFGERWGRHWLDVVRYGESTGMERNFTFPYAWRYRDYVIGAFNADKPFDRFLTEQVAGDLLPFENVAQRDEHLIATGLLALGTKSLNETNREKFAMDVVDEQIDVTTQAFMAFTASCARCHDHKFDPVPQNEYYALAGVFRSTNTFYGTGGGRGNRQAGGLLALSTEGVSVTTAKGGAYGNKKKNVAIQIKKLRAQLPRLNKQVANNNNAAAKKRLATAQRQIKKLQSQLKPSKTDAAPPKNATLVMAVRDSSNPADTEYRIRGEANERGKTIPRGFPTILSGAHVPLIKEGKSGRLAYAKWMTGDDNPLTSRVAVNRIWMHLFGRGIVTTVNNFGATGAQPTHPELLDHLASEFKQDGWSVKNMIRSIVNSRVYQLSVAASESAEAVDPDNNLLWRMNQRRLEAEAIRDAILAAGGELDLTPGEGSVVQTVGDGDIGRTIRAERFTTAGTKRSVYLPIVRGAVPEVLQVFDFPDPSIIFGQREVTTVPTQALFMLNSPFAIEQASKFAKRVLAEEATDQQRVRRAYRLALSRAPTDAETDATIQFLDETSAALETGKRKSDAARLKAWTGFCQTLFASSEFRYVN